MAASEELLVFKVGQHNELLNVFCSENPLTWKPIGRPPDTLTRLQLRDFVHSFLDTTKTRPEIGRHWRDKLDDLGMLPPDGTLDLTRLRIIDNRKQLVSDLPTLCERFESMTVFADIAKETPAPVEFEMQGFIDNVIAAGKKGNAHLLALALALDGTHEFRVPILLELVRAYRKERRLHRAREILQIVRSRRTNHGRFQLRITLEKYWLDFLQSAGEARPKARPEQLAGICRGTAIDCTSKGFLLTGVDFATLAALYMARSNDMPMPHKVAAFDDALRQALACGQLDRVHGAYFNRGQFLSETAEDRDGRTAGILQMCQSLTFTVGGQVRADLFCPAVIAQALADDPSIDPASVGIAKPEEYIRGLLRDANQHRKQNREPSLVRVRLLAALRELAAIRDPGQLANCERSIAKEAALRTWSDGLLFPKPDQLDLCEFERSLVENNMEVGAASVRSTPVVVTQQPVTLPQQPLVESPKKSE